MEAGSHVHPDGVGSPPHGEDDESCRVHRRSCSRSGNGVDYRRDDLALQVDRDKYAQLRVAGMIELLEIEMLCA